MALKLKNASSVSIWKNGEWPQSQVDTSSQAVAVEMVDVLQLSADGSVDIYADNEADIVATVTNPGGAGAEIIATDPNFLSQNQWQQPTNGSGGYGNYYSRFILDTGSGGVGIRG